MGEARPRPGDNGVTAPDEELSGETGGRMADRAAVTKAASGDAIATARFPVELPIELRGLEEIILELAHDFVGQTKDADEFERAVRAAIGTIERQISSYRALSRIATRESSLPAQLRSTV